MAKNFLEKTVRFNIQRKPDLADSLLPYKIYINGQYVGVLKNGRTISAEVPRAEIYYIDGGSFEQNAVIRNENKAEYNLVLRTRGGWRTEAHCEFYICADAQMQQLPSFHFDKLLMRFLMKILNGCPTMNRHWRFASNFGTTLLMMFRSFLHLNEYIR